MAAMTTTTTTTPVRHQSVQLSVLVHPFELGQDLTMTVLDKVEQQLVGAFVTQEERVEQIERVLIQSNHDCKCIPEQGLVQIGLKVDMITRSFEIGSVHAAVVEMAMRHSVAVLIESDHSLAAAMQPLRFIIMFQDLSKMGQYLFTDRKEVPMYEHKNVLFNLYRGVRVLVRIKAHNSTDRGKQHKPRPTDTIGTVELIHVFPPCTDGPSKPAGTPVGLAMKPTLSRSSIEASTPSSQPGRKRTRDCS